MKIKRELQSDVVLKKGNHGWEAWQTNKLLFKTHGFSNKSKEEVMKHIPGYENVIESSNDSMTDIGKIYGYTVEKVDIGWYIPEIDKQFFSIYDLKKFLRENDKRNLKSSRQIQSRFYQNGGNNLYSLSECAQYLAALFFDLRTIHFKATGSEFYTYHELAQELYEKADEYYDDMIETALGYDSNVSAMYVLPGDWGFVDENGSFDTNGQVVQTLILERLERIYDVLENVQDYDSMVSSKIDGMLEYFDKEIYKLSQALR